MSREGLETELGKFGPRSISARLCYALLASLPNSPAAEPWTDLAGCLASVDPQSTLGPRVYELSEDDGVGRALFAAKAIDTGDIGITILTRVRSALSLFMGDKGPRVAADRPQTPR